MNGCSISIARRDQQVARDRHFPLVRLALGLFGVGLAAAGCSTVQVTHVAGNDFNSPGVRYWLPAPYLLVRSPVELSRTETLYSLSPIERTILRPVVPCDNAAANCGPLERTSGPATSHPPAVPFGAQAGRKPVEGGSAAPDHDHDHHHDPGAPPASIVWLPDYCQQYAIVEKDHSGSQKVQIQLAEGWKLTALNTEINNTEILQKMFDALSNVASSVVSTSHAGTTTVAGAGAQAVGTGSQSAQTRLFRRTHIVTFRPGLYQLLEYPLTKDNELDCSKLPSFRPPKDATEQSESWSEVVTPAVGITGATETLGGVPAAPVEPGRPAPVVRPPLR